MPRTVFSSPTRSHIALVINEPGSWVGFMLVTLALTGCPSSVPSPADTTSPSSPSAIETQASPLCGTASGPPVITISPATIATAQRPGRQFIGMALTPGGRDRDGLVVVVDDAPGLPSSSVRVNLEIDPTRGVANKMLEFWSPCRTNLVRTIQATMLGGFGVGVICSSPFGTNNFSSGCTNTETITIDRLDRRFLPITEFWFRKQCGVFGWAWCDAGVMDSSFWQAFGGRSVRFIWFAD